MTYLRMGDLNFKGLRVLIREDLNVPLQQGKITDDTRIRACVPTIQQALLQGAAVIVLSHLGRPEEGVWSPVYSLEPVAAALSQALNCPVHFKKDWVNGVEAMPGTVTLCENVRFQRGEEKDDPLLAQKIAGLADVFVMDAFATAHRAQASTVGVAQYAKKACAGLLLDQELQALSKALLHPAKPVLAIVGGSKVSTKLLLLENLLNRVDSLIVGGGIANTFLAAVGVEVGGSLYEPQCLEQAKTILAKAKALGVHMPLPIDVVVAQHLEPAALGAIKALDQIEAADKILDIGPLTIALYQAALQRARTILWNGPVGVFEHPAFSAGTKALAETVAHHDSAFSLAGGGDTLAALSQFGLTDKMSYISTGGGAFLEFMEGKTLPAVAILEERAVCHVEM